LRRRNVLVADIIAEGLSQASPLLERRAHRLHLSVPRTDEFQVDGDPERLTQVVGNLLTNAAKYTPEGGDIWIEARRTGGDIRISVRDNGIGITPEAQSRIFELFARDRASETRTPGLGIGLAIVRHLVQLHGGTVAVRSEGIGKGATFEVLIPRASVVPAALPVPANVPLLLSGPPHKILVVDDNEDAAMTLADVLRALGHTVEVALDSPSALKRAGTFHPEVALLDIGLPVMDGYELSQELRALPGLAALRIIAITGYGQARDSARSAAAGFEAHLTKPVDPRELQTLIGTPRTH
jgi:CheY-like chemotaxis protein